MNPFGLVLAALAAWQAVEVWHHGSIFATRRATVQTWPDEGVRGWLKQLLTCPFCLSVWVGTAVAAVIVADLPAGEGWHHWVWFLGLGALKLFCYGLAVSRLSNLANDLTGDFSRTPDQTKGWPPDGGDASLPPGADPSANNDIEGNNEHSPTVPFPGPGGPPGGPA